MFAVTFNNSIHMHGIFKEMDFKTNNYVAEYAEDY